MFAINCTDIRPNLILILPRTPKKQSKVKLLLCGNVLNDFMDFEAWIHKKHKYLNTWEWNVISSSNKKIIHCTLTTGTDKK